MDGALLTVIARYAECLHRGYTSWLRMTKDPSRHKRLRLAFVDGVILRHKVQSTGAVVGRSIERIGVGTHYLILLQASRTALGVRAVYPYACRFHAIALGQLWKALAADWPHAGWCSGPAVFVMACAFEQVVAQIQPDQWRIGRETRL